MVFRLLQFASGTLLSLRLYYYTPGAFSVCSIFPEALIPLFDEIFPFLFCKNTLKRRCQKSAKPNVFFYQAYNLDGILKYQIIYKKSESLQTEGRHFSSMICKLSDV